MSQSLPYTEAFRLERVSEGKYRIRGKILCPSLGWRWKIEALSDGIVSDPVSARFLLSATGPGVGGDQVEELLVDYEFDENKLLEGVAVHLAEPLKSETGAARLAPRLD